MFRPSTHQASTIASEIAAATAPRRIVGGGTWLQGGGPWVDATPLSTRDLRGVVEYRPGDLVITVQAGTTLADLAAVTGAHGQMLALSPYGSPESTVGALIATAAPAPLAFGGYTVRDLVLGLDVVTGTGDVTRAGGRVVKNVAGFDLVRLHTGAWGTLGVITEVSLRLHARPEVDVVVAASLPDTSADRLDTLLSRMLALRAPLPMLLVCPPQERPQLWARLSGNRARAGALRAELLTFGVEALTDVPPDDVQRQLLDTPPAAIVLRARTHRSDAAPFVRAARDAFPDATLHYDPLHGSLRVVRPAATAVSLERDMSTWYRLAATGGAMHTISVVVDQGRSPDTPFRAPRSSLDEGLKRAFDPRDLLNRVAPDHPVPSPSALAKA